jgi:hypothetical protein
LAWILYPLPVSSDLKYLNIPHQTVVYAAGPGLYLAEVLIFSLMLSQALFMSSSSLKFFKAAKLFVTSI